MIYEIDTLSGDSLQLAQLAKAYYRSYTTLSKAYKTKEEMALYTPEYFLARLKAMHQDKKSSLYILTQSGIPLGFVRFSELPKPYLSADKGLVQEKESGVLDGVAYDWTRVTRFEKGVRLTPNTLILNQIYLDPSIQGQGIGVAFLAKTLDMMSVFYYDFIVEYNTQNKNAKKFYQGFEIKPIAQTQDLDHIIGNKKYISPVEIGYAMIKDALKAYRGQKLLTHHQVNWASLDGKVRV